MIQKYQICLILYLFISIQLHADEAEPQCGFQRQAACFDGEAYSCLEGCGLGSDYKCYGSCEKYVPVIRSDCGGLRQDACFSDHVGYHCNAGCGLGSDYKCYGSCAMNLLDELCPGKGQAAIVISADDAAPNQDAAFEYLYNHGIRATVFGYQHHNSDLIMQKAVEFNHEIGVHGDARGDKEADLEKNLKYAKLFGAQAPYVFALPFGNPAYLPYVKSRDFMGARSTRCVTAVPGQFSAFNTPGCSLRTTTTREEVVHWIQRAKDEQGILITYFHSYDQNTAKMLRILMQYITADPAVYSLTFSQALMCAKKEF